MRFFPKAASWVLQTPQCSASQPKRADSAVGTRRRQPHRERLARTLPRGGAKSEPCAVSGRGCLEAGVWGLALEGGRGRPAGRRAREARARSRRRGHGGGARVLRRAVQRLRRSRPWSWAVGGCYSEPRRQLEAECWACRCRSRAGAAAGAVDRAAGSGAGGGARGR